MNLAYRPDVEYIFIKMFKLWSLNKYRIAKWYIIIIIIKSIELREDELYKSVARLCYKNITCLKCVK